MNFVEVWTDEGWVKKDSLSDLVVGDVFRISSTKMVGATMICYGKAGRITLPSGGNAWNTNSRLLNANKASVCMDCAVVLDSDAHSDSCPCCGSKLESLSKSTFTHRVFVSPPKQTSQINHSSQRVH